MMILKTLLLTLLILPQASANPAKILGNLARPKSFAWVFQNEGAVPWVRQVLPNAVLPGGRGAIKLNAEAFHGMPGEEASVFLNQVIGAEVARSTLNQLGYGRNAGHDRLLRSFFQYRLSRSHGFFAGVSPWREATIFQTGWGSSARVADSFSAGRVQVVQRTTGESEFWVQMADEAFPIHGVTPKEAGENLLVLGSFPEAEVAAQRFVAPNGANFNHLFHIDGTRRVFAFKRSGNNPFDPITQSSSAGVRPTFEKIEQPVIEVGPRQSILSLAATPTEGGKFHFAGLIREGGKLRIESWPNHSLDETLRPHAVATRDLTDITSHDKPTIFGIRFFRNSVKLRVTVDYTKASMGLTRTSSPFNPPPWAPNF